MNRLFVPLTTKAFLDFENNGKSYELRACGRGFSERFVYAGRLAELRKGYSGKSIHGTIGRVVTGTLEDIFKEIDFKLIEPMVRTKEEAIQENLRLLGQKPKYITFEIVKC